MNNKANKTISWFEVLRKYGTVIGTVFIFIIFSLVIDRFFTFRNLFMLLRQMSMLTIIACGFTFVMAAGGFDMSIGNVTGLVGMIFAIVLVNTSNFWLSLLVGLGVGLFVGLINAMLVAYINLPDFIGTLAVGSIAYGIKMLLTKGNPIFIMNPPEIFTFIGQGYVGAIPFPVILMLVFLVITIFILHKTKLGRRIYAIGGNTIASVYAGINVKWYRMITFLVSGLSVSIAAIIMTSRLNSGQPLAGENFLLDVIAAVFLSTTMFGEGEPNAMGAFVGALIISMLNNGLTMLNVPYYFQYITKGMVVIAAVMLAVVMGQKLRVKF
jgi:ribose/xylose/arabinose/galactoside ABC-type transport system permease subunit